MYFVLFLVVLLYIDVFILELLVFIWVIWFIVCVDGFICLGVGVDWVDKVWIFDGVVK